MRLALAALVAVSALIARSASVPWWYPTVVDIAPCWGTWSIRFRDRGYVKDVSSCVQVDYGE